VGAESIHPLAGERYRPGGGALEAADGLQEGALAGAVGPDDGEDLALVNPNVTPSTAGKPPKRFSTASTASSVMRYCGRNGSSGSETSSLLGYQVPASFTPSGAGPRSIRSKAIWALANSPHSVQRSSNE
jgi:hypothetical protein